MFSPKLKNRLQFSRKAARSPEMLKLDTNLLRRTPKQSKNPQLKPLKMKIPFATRKGIRSPKARAKVAGLLSPKYMSVSNPESTTLNPKLVKKAKNRNDLSQKIKIMMKKAKKSNSSVRRRDLSVPKGNLLQNQNDTFTRSISNSNKKPRKMSRIFVQMTDEETEHWEMYQDYLEQRIQRKVADTKRSRFGGLVSPFKLNQKALHQLSFSNTRTTLDCSTLTEAPIKL